MLTHVENVVNKNWLQKLSHLLRLFSYRSNKTSKCGQTVCGSMWHTHLPRAPRHKFVLFEVVWRQAQAFLGIDRRQLDVYLFAFLPSDFANVFRQIVTSVETLSSANLFALGYGEKASPSPAGIDVRRKHAWCRCCWYPIFGHFPFCLTHWS